MQLTQFQLFHPVGVRALQGTIRTTGTGATAKSIETSGAGVIVTLLDGARWACNAAGVGLLDPDAEPPPVQQPPMPAAKVRK